MNILVCHENLKEVKGEHPIELFYLFFIRTAGAMSACGPKAVEFIVSVHISQSCIPQKAGRIFLHLVLNNNICIIIIKR